MAPTEQTSLQACRVVCLGGMGFNESEYLKDILPAGVGLFHADNELSNMETPLETPYLWHLGDDFPDPTMLGPFEAKMPSLLEGVYTLFIVIGLGGKTGTSLCLMLASAAQAKGIQIFALSRRRSSLKESATGPPAKL